MTNAKAMTIDLVDFYLGTPLTRPEWLRIPIKFIPADVIMLHSLEDYIVNGSILFCVLKGMYGLPQAGKLAQERLVAHMALSGYTEDPNVPCLFAHTSNGITFTLVIDDFLVKYHARAGVEHLIACLEVLYALHIDWTGTKYLGITLEWNYIDRSVTLSMPKYVDKILQRFPRRGPQLQAKSPAIYVPWHPRTGPQLTDSDDSPPLTPAEIKEVQEIVGCFLWYGRVIDSSLLPAVNAIGAEMVGPTQRLLRSCERLLSYAAAYPNNTLVYRASDMILELQCDASYLSRSRSRSVAGGLGYFGARASDGSINGPVFTHSTVLDVVVASAAEAEYGGTFTIAQQGEFCRTVAIAVGHMQPATIIYCDNKCAVGLANDTLKQRRSKCVDMRYHWVRDRVRQKHFQVLWLSGKDVLADFFTKALPVHRHQELMKLLVTVPVAPANHFLSSRARTANAHRAKTI